jgi:hypothetical protein
METLDNMGIKCLHWLHLKNISCIFHYTFVCLCCVMLSVNALQIVGARLAEASVTKTPTLLGVSRATVSKVMKTSSDTRNCG